MNMHSNHKDNRTYADLRGRFPSWLEKWIEHFQVHDFTELTVHYVNRLDHTTLSSFAREGLLEIDKVLRIFFNISGENEVFTPPMDCQVTIKLKGDTEGSLLIHATDQSSDSFAALTLNLVATTTLRKGQGTEEILRLMDWCHERIVERFEMIFTDEAKLSFEPYGGII